MTYDEFYNYCIKWLMDNGYLEEPEPVIINDKRFYKHMWLAKGFNAKGMGYDNFEYCYIKIKGDNTMVAFNYVSLDASKTKADTKLGYANAINVNEFSQNVDVESKQIMFTNYGDITPNIIDYSAKSNLYSQYLYPSNSPYDGWYMATQGIDEPVKRQNTGAHIISDAKESPLIPCKWNINSHEAYLYLKGGEKGTSSFSEQTKWTCYLDSREVDGTLYDSNVKLTWHNDDMDNLLDTVDNASDGYIVKVWAGLPKLFSDSSTTHLDVIELGEYDYSDGYMLTNFSGMYNELTSTYSKDILYEIFHGKQVYLVFSVYKDDEQKSSTCYVVINEKAPNTSTSATASSWGQQLNAFSSIIPNNVTDTSTVSIEKGTGEEDNGANNDNDEDIPNNGTSDDINLLTGGLSQVYQVPITRLNQLGRFIWNDNAMENIKLLNASPIQNIVSCKAIPFSSASFTTKNIILGNIDTGVLGDRVNSNIGKKLIGTINITPPYNNFLSFGSFTSVTIYLPYVGLKQLDTDRVMGKTLAIYYNVDCVSGSATVEICANNIKLYEFSCNVSIDIALTASNRAEIEKGYITSAIGGGVSLASGNVVGALGSGLNASLQKYNYSSSGTCSGSSYASVSKQCYVIIEYPDLLDNNTYKSIYGKPLFKKHKLNELHGFTMCDVNNIKIASTKEENEEIEQLLNNGIIL